MDFFTFIGNREIVLVTTFLSMYFTVFAVYFTLIKSRSHKRKSDIEKSYKLLLKGIEQNTLDSQAISLIYTNQIARRYSMSFLQFMESFIIYVRKQDEDGLITKTVSELVVPIIEKEKEEKPYSYLEEKDRHLLLSIEDSARRNEPQSVSSHLTDLSLMIDSNQKALHRSRVINAWTIPISILGVLLTLFIWLYGSRLSDSDIERISKEISTYIITDYHTQMTDSLKAE